MPSNPDLRFAQPCDCLDCTERRLFESKEQIVRVNSAIYSNVARRPSVTSLCRGWKRAAGRLARQKALSHLTFLTKMDFRAKLFSRPGCAIIEPSDTRPAESGFRL